jgi:hypothetical protein
MRRWVIIIAATIAITLVAYAAYYPYSPARVQARNMRAAEAFIPTARAALGNDPRFGHVKMYPYTGEGGALGIRGVVRTGDLAELKKRIEGAGPPVAVCWRVEEVDEPLFSEVTKPGGDAE